MRSKAPRLAGLLALGIATAGPLLAQDIPPVEDDGGDSPVERTSEDFVLVTRFLEAFKAKKFQDAIDVFTTLDQEGHHHVIAQKPRLRFIVAQAYLEEDEPEAAGQQLETLLQVQENHIDALYLLASILYKNKDQQDEERAKDLLTQSARAGQYVLRDINSADGKKVFGELLTDPGFILRIMNAANEFHVTSPPDRNPFASPLRKGGDEGPDVVEPKDIQRQRQLETQIEALFEDIMRLAEDGQYQELIAKFTDLRRIMSDYGDLGTEGVRRKLEEWNQRLDDLGEVKLSIKLQVYINEGNQHLRAMHDAIREERYDAALQRFQEIQEIVADMRDEERDVFHRNADALELRGQELATRARRLKKISEFELLVTGIIVAPPDGKDPNSAIINDRIYHQGDTIIDNSTDEEIEGLRVERIVRSTVTFRFEDTEFVRELKGSSSTP